MDDNEKWAIHRTSDPIGLLSVTVTLKRTRQSPNLTRPEVEQAEQARRKASNNDETESDDNVTNGSEISDHENDNDNNNRDVLQDNDDDIITKTIGLKTRLCSPTEVKEYLNKSKELSTVAEKIIHDKIEEDPTYKGEEIFTKIKGDEYVDESEIDKPFRDRKGGNPTEVASAFLKKKGDDKILEMVPNQSQPLHIFASLTAVDGSQYEHLLCIIRAYNDGRIEVRPPFSNKCTPRKEYHFQIPNSGEVTYWIDVNEDKTDEETPFERTLLGDIKRRRGMRIGLSDCPLNRPPDNAKAIRMFYRGEIATCEMFEAENVAVEYNVKFPNGWTASEVFGCSQLADVKDIDGIAHINFPIDFEAICDKTQMAPTLQVVLHSYTDMNSRIVVGYGSVQLPMTCGSHTLTFDVWRVRGTVLEELKLQFLESGLEIQPSVESGMSDLLSEPSTESGLPSNKFGLRTIGTGKVTVKFNLAMQSRQFALKQTEYEPPMSQLGNISSRDPTSFLRNSRLNNT